MTRYSKRVREEAALICAIAASTPKFDASFSRIADCLGIKSMPTADSLALACRAWFTIHSYSEQESLFTRSAATEQLLRTGWTPD